MNVLLGPIEEFRSILTLADLNIERRIEAFAVEKPAHHPPTEFCDRMLAGAVTQAKLARWTTWLGADPLCAAISYQGLKSKQD
jgi:hypothetical protein